MPRSDQDKDARTVLAALTIERLAPHIYTIAELTNRQSESLLRLSGVEQIVVGDWYAGVILGSATRTPGLVSVLNEILTTETGNAFYTVDVPNELAGMTVGHCHDLLLKKHQAILVSIERASLNDGDVIVNPPIEQVLESGDRLVVLARRRVRL